MMGERVAVFTRTEAGRDSMGEPVYEWRSREVSNVLVRPLSATDESTAERPEGVAVSYRLAFPKGAGVNLRHARVALLDRGMDADDADAAYEVAGDPDITKPCPTAWDLLADIGRRDG